MLWAALSGALLTGVLPPAGVAHAGDTTRALEVVARGTVARAKGDLLTACAFFSEGVRLQPNWAAARFELGRCQRLLGDPDGTAQAHMAYAVQTMPNRPALRLELARLALDLGALDLAASTRRDAAETPPKGEAPRALEAWAMSGPLKAPETLVNLRWLAVRRPLDLAAWRRLAAVAEAQGALSEAEAAWWVIVDRSANPRAALAGLGRFARRHARSGTAATVLQRLRASGSKKETKTDP